MEYLIIDGSPHRGNTWKVVETVRDQITAATPDTRFSVLRLRELNLPYCTGCSACFRKGSVHCPHRAPMEEILTLMARADGLILSFTTFNMAPNALMKNFLDHLCYLLHRPHFFTKKALVITSTGGVGAGKAAKYVAGMLRAIGFNRCYALPVKALSWNAYQPSEKMLARQQCMADKFHRDVASGALHAPGFSVLMVYNLFRGMSRAYAPGTKYATQDGVHWTDAKRARRVYDASVPVRNPLKQLFGGMFYLIGRLAAKFTMVTYDKKES